MAPFVHPDCPDHFGRRLRHEPYLTVPLFALNCADVALVVGWELNLARWLGFAVGFVTVVSVLVKLFGQRALTWHVRWWAARPGHVVVGGLGRAEADTDRLVEQLRAAGRDVVVTRSGRRSRSR